MNCERCGSAMERLMVQRGLVKVKAWHCETCGLFECKSVSPEEWLFPMDTTPPKPQTPLRPTVPLPNPK